MSLSAAALVARVEAVTHLSECCGRQVATSLLGRVHHHSVGGSHDDRGATGVDATRYALSGQKPQQAHKVSGSHKS